MENKRRNSSFQRLRKEKTSNPDNPQPKTRTTKLQDRLTYCPQKHKQKNVRLMRQKLSTRAPPKPRIEPPPKTTIRFGSLNINGLDLEATWAVEQLLETHSLDVSFKNILHYIDNRIIQILALSETFGRSDQHCTLPPITGFSSWKTERGGSDKGGGGLCILYKPSLTPHHWTPQVPSDLQYVTNERQWLLLDNGKERCAFLHTYIACQSRKNDDFLKWNEDLFHLLTEEAIQLRKQGFIVVSLGDFNSRVGVINGLEGNTPDTNQNTPMFLNFISQVNLTIINTLPVARGLFTRFMNNSDLPGSKSLLDYGLVDNDHVHTVTSFTIDEDARYDAGTDHALLAVELVFGHTPAVNWSYRDVLKFDLKDDSDYGIYQTTLDQHASLIPLHQFESLPSEKMLSHITSCITESGKKAFGLKIKKAKKNRKLPPSVIQKIKTKNDYARAVKLAHHLKNPEVDAMEATLTTLKTEIKELCSNLRLKQRNRLRSRDLLADPSRKRFWRFLKHQIKAAGCITGAYDHAGNMVFQQDQIEDAVFDHFSQSFLGQKVPVFTDPEPQDQVDLIIQELEAILANSPVEHPETKFEDLVCSPYSFTELDKLLADLPLGKACGYDQVPNELLKNSSLNFKLYLLAFLNQILQDGKVPTDLNIGKCILIHKV